MNSNFEVGLTGKQVDLHAVLHHRSVGPSLVKVSPNCVSTVPTNYDTAHASLIESFCDLTKVIFGVVGVGVNDDDLPNVLLSNLVDGRQ